MLKKRRVKIAINRLGSRILDRRRLVNVELEYVIYVFIVYLSLKFNLYE